STSPPSRRSTPGPPGGIPAPSQGVQPTGAARTVSGAGAPARRPAAELCRPASKSAPAEGGGSMARRIVRTVAVIAVWFAGVVGLLVLGSLPGDAGHALFGDALCGPWG